MMRTDAQPSDAEVFAMSNAEWLADWGHRGSGLPSSLLAGAIGELGGFPLIRHPSCPPGTVFVLNPDFMLPPLEVDTA